MPLDVVVNEESDRTKLRVQIQLFKNLHNSEDRTRKKHETPLTKKPINC